MVRVPGIVSPEMNVQIETLIQGLRMVSVASSWVTRVGSPLRSALREVSVYPGLSPEESGRDGYAKELSRPRPLSNILSNIQVLSPPPQPFFKACNLTLGVPVCC